jgi:16S rRNA processing protein RimM
MGSGPERGSGAVGARARPDWDDMVLVGRVARPHGLRGDVVVSPETDFVDQRFRVDATLYTRGARGEEVLTVSALRMQGARAIVRFEGFARVEDAERLAGQELRVPEEDLQALEPGQYYHHQLVGCTVVTVDGEAIGDVERVEGGAGGSRLVVGGRRGEVLVPLAAEICVDIDPAARRIRIDPPEGLLDLNEVRHRDDLSAHGRSRPRGGGGRARH